MVVNISAPCANHAARASDTSVCFPTHKSEELEIKWGHRSDVSTRVGNSTQCSNMFKRLLLAQSPLGSTLKVAVVGCKETSAPPGGLI